MYVKYPMISPFSEPIQNYVRNLVTEIHPNFKKFLQEKH